jgi:hypothetical protein
VDLLLQNGDLMVPDGQVALMQAVVPEVLLHLLH